jgi:DNA-binding MarR family transcriptional regulator
MDKDEQWIRLLPLMKSVIKEMRNEWYRQVDDSLSNTQFHLLAKLDRHGPMKATDLADALMITNSTLTALVDKMCERQLVTRERSACDRRVVDLEITDKGRKLAEGHKDVERSAFKKYFDRLSPEDLKHLEEIFVKLHRKD